MLLSEPVYRGRIQLYQRVCLRAWPRACVSTAWAQHVHTHTHTHTHAHTHTHTNTCEDTCLQLNVPSKHTPSSPQTSYHWPRPLHHIAADKAHSSSSSALARPMQPPPQWAHALLTSVSTNLDLYCGQSLSLVLVSLERLGNTPDQVTPGVQGCARMHTHTHTHAHAHTHTHTHTRFTRHATHAHLHTYPFPYTRMHARSYPTTAPQSPHQPVDPTHKGAHPITCTQAWAARIVAQLTGPLAAGLGPQVCVCTTVGSSP